MRSTAIGPKEPFASGRCMLIGQNLLKIKADGGSRSALTRTEIFREIKSGAQKNANQVKGFV
ncbi:hypothetical protein DK867_14740 [Ochrobactrum sp. POC9]|nr:hypothetical protein DK867_14740 [Ochrobactrum sp. POC9]